MKYLLFLKEFDTLTPMGEFKSEEEIDKKINEYIQSINFKSYYFRSHGKNPKVCDFGSHTMFFHIYEV